MEEESPEISPTECVQGLRTRYTFRCNIDPAKLEEERQKLTEINQTPFFKRIAGYTKFSGPGFIQSAVTLGAGSASAALIAGSKYGYSLIWVGPMTMILGMFMFFAMAKQAVAVRRCPYEAMRNELHYAFAFLFGLSALLASIIWHFPQYTLAAHAANDLAGVATGRINPIPAWVLGAAFLGFATFVTWNYGKGHKGIRVYEKTLKALVWLIVITFALVVVKTGVKWGSFFEGLIPRWPRLPDGSFDRNQANLIIAILGATIGVNMVFLYPYSVLARGWGREHNRLAYFDLVSGMALPFVLATSFVVIATANVIYPKEAKTAVEAAKVLESVVGPVFGHVIFGLGMLAIGLSTITVHMLMCAFILSEMFGIEPCGWRFRLMVLTPAVGALGVAWKLPFGIAVSASSLCVIFLPIAYICFLVLHNKRSFMGEAMPRGGKRAFWNTGMAVAIAVVTTAAVVKLSIEYQKTRRALRQEQTSHGTTGRPGRNLKMTPDSRNE